MGTEGRLGEGRAVDDEMPVLMDYLTALKTDLSLEEYISIEQTLLS